MQGKGNFIFLRKGWWSGPLAPPIVVCLPMSFHSQKQKEMAKDSRLFEIISLSGGFISCWGRFG